MKKFIIWLLETKEFSLLVRLGAILIGFGLIILLVVIREKHNLLP